MVKQMHFLHLRTALLLRIFPQFKHVRYNIFTREITDTKSMPHTLPSNASPNKSQSPSPPFSRKPHIPHEVIESNKKIASHIKLGDFNSAMQVFLNMKMKTTVTWNTMLSGFSRKHGKLEEARNLFDKIPEPDIVSYNTMLACYFKNAAVEAAKYFFDRIPVKDIASWNTMISGLSQNGWMDEVKALFGVMPRRNDVTWNAIISGYVEAGDMESALELFDKAPMKGVVSWTSIITGYMRCGKVKLAEKTFQEMSEKNLVTWNAMIAGYVENGCGEDGLKLFKKMLILKIQTNPSSFTSVFLACSNLSMLKLGKQVHQFVYKSPLYLDTIVGTSLISMYSKCGVLQDSWKLFSEMSRKDLVTWNAMISGYAQHGVSDKALNLFNEMISKEMKPDGITFIGVLSACNHAGLVDLGIQYFQSMQKDYRIELKPDHYTCMVDLLGRAGRLNEAMDLIKKMPFERHAGVYGTLLGACRIHKNMEIAEFAAENLLRLDHNNPTAYVPLANVYAAKKNWVGVSKVRRSMKENKIIKTPGYSWIEIKGVMHEFRSGDMLHPELQQIHGKLTELEKKMKLAGYVADLESALHDVEEKQKERILLWHSEKLAVSFGLLRVPLCVAITIFKNLRVCGDCHRAMKFISEIEGREIVVRDTVRFHYFRDGKCSCGDYW